jgi:hypothetical protein
MDDVRTWYYYPIEMPLSADGQGPATVGVDAAKITYEVWDRALTTHASFDNLPDAINEAMRLNAALTPAPAPDARAEGEGPADRLRAFLAARDACDYDDDEIDYILGETAEDVQRLLASDIRAILAPTVSPTPEEPP